MMCCYIALLMEACWVKQTLPLEAGISLLGVGAVDICAAFLSRLAVDRCQLPGILGAFSS
jgi:hypothetical protein